MTIKEIDQTTDCDSKQKEICPKFERTFSILGKKWMGLIIDVLLEGPQRFKNIATAIPNVSDRVLVERLKELEQEGLVLRTVDPKATMRVAYSLTKKGTDLKDVMKAVQIWADEWVCIDEE
ncbi:MAG: helix-turn-helix domain-containing protein [Carnobacterium sp.]|uniref:winged helix-turn-helix transcriptional regulator n=1 Tax=Carnobacterium sp. TaxID=48221 RepID=UPI003C788E67